MNRTAIEWVKNPDGSQGYTWNPITGCLNHDNGLCKGGGFPCYAYKLAHGRLKGLYLGNNYARYPAEKHNDPFYPRFWEERLLELPNNVVAGKERGIFVCDMGDLFSIGVPESWTRQIIERIKGWPEFRFYLLTKQPQNLVKFSPFPKNAWVGVTCTNQTMVLEATNHLYNHRIAKTQFLSIEPLLSWDTSHFSRPLTDSISKLDIDWLIIGACTGSASGIGKVQRKYPELSHKPYKNQWTAQPRIEWVRAIVEAADKAGIKVFLKDNLKPLLVQNKGSAEYAPLWANGGYGTLRQEMPK